MPRGKRKAASKKEFTQVLPGQLGEKEQQEIAVRVIEKFGKRQSLEAGIDLENGGDAALEQWFLLAVLFSRGISAGQVVNTYKVLFEGGVRNVSVAGKLEYKELWDKLSEGKAQRRDRTTKQLQSLNQVLQDKYGGSVAQLLSSTQDPHEMRANIEALPYIGPTTAELFLRDLREMYPQVKEVLDVSERALEAAVHLGLFSKIGRTTKRQKGGENTNAQQPIKAIDGLDEIAKSAGVDCRDLETALIKLHNAHYRAYAKSPGGLESVALQGGGEKEEHAEQETGAEAEGSKEAAAGEEKPADVDMKEADDVSKEQNADVEDEAPREEEAAAAGKEPAADVSKEDGADASKAGDADVKEGDADVGKEEPVETAEGEKEAPAEGGEEETAEKAADETITPKEEEKKTEPEVEEKGMTAEAANGELEKDAPPQEGAEKKGEETETAEVGGEKAENGGGREEKEAPSEVPRLEDEGEKAQKKEGGQSGEKTTELKAGA